MKICSFFKKYQYFFLFLIIGLTIIVYPMFKNNFELLASNWWENLFNTYLLEHSWLYIHQEKLHESFWSAPFYYPNENNIIFNNDMLFGIMPFYWFFRIFNNNPFDISQILIILLSIFNYISFYYLLKKKINFCDLSSSLGSFIFAFSLLRLYRIEQIQFFSQFLSIIALIFIFNVKKENKPYLNHIFFFLGSIFIALQFYTCYSLGFYFIFIGISTLILGLLPKTSRDVIIEYFSNFKKYIIFYSISTYLLLSALISNFVAIQNVKTISLVLQLSQNSTCWLRNISVLDNLFLSKIKYLGDLNINEISCSIGIFAMIISLIGIWKLKYAKGLPILVLILCFICSCRFLGFFPWKYFYYFTLGSAGIEFISRISFGALIIFSIGIANFIEYFKNSNTKFKPFILLLTMFLLIFENIPLNKDPNSAWRGYFLNKNEFVQKIDEIENKIPNETKIIYLTSKPINIEKYGIDDKKIKLEKLRKYTDILALWVGLKNKKYVINSYFETDKDIENQKISEFYKINEKIDIDKI